MCKKMQTSKNLYRICPAGFPKDYYLQIRVQESDTTNKLTNNVEEPSYNSISFENVVDSNFKTFFDDSDTSSSDNSEKDNDI